MKTEENFTAPLPSQDLKELSFCGAGKPAIKQWLKSLPAANPGIMAQQLYEAIIEINRLDTTFQQRFDILAVLRPAVYLVCKGLERDYLHQSITMSSKAGKVVKFTQALQQQLSVGYAITALQCTKKIQGFSFSRPSNLMAKSIHFAISDASRVLERNFQLYRPTPDGIWLGIHQLYLLAQRYKLSEHKVTDLQTNAGHKSSVSNIYHRTLLLGCIKANQVRQKDIDLIYESLDYWVSLIKLIPVESDQEDSFIIDPTLDIPPIYQKFYKGDYSDQCHCMDTSKLIEKLTHKKDRAVDDKESGLSLNLLHHLLAAWGKLANRSFIRLESNDKLALCVGLSTTHYFVSGEIAFADLITGQNDENKESDALCLTNEGNRTSEWHDMQRSNTSQDDVWNKVYEFKEGASVHHSQADVSLDSIEFHINDGAQSPGETKKPQRRECYHHHEVKMLNLSPDGYALQWPDEAPLNLKTGEIIGIKETTHSTWSIGTIRWLNQNPQNPGQALQLGVELLSPTAIPYAARIIDKASIGTYLRVLLLPKIATIGQQETLLTPAINFKQGQKVLLVLNDEEIIIKLTKLLCANYSYSQFEFEERQRISNINITGLLPDSEEHPPVR